MKSSMWHRLNSINEETRTAVCSFCCDTKIELTRNNGKKKWRCALKPRKKKKLIYGQTTLNYFTSNTSNNNNNNNNRQKVLTMPKNHLIPFMQNSFAVGGKDKIPYEIFNPED